MMMAVVRSVPPVIIPVRRVLEALLGIVLVARLHSIGCCMSTRAHAPLDISTTDLPPVSVAIIHAQLPLAVTPGVPDA